MLGDGWYLTAGVLLALVLALAATNLVRGEWELAVLGVGVAVVVLRIMAWDPHR